MRPVYFSPENYPRYVGTARGIPEYYPRSSSSSQEPFQPIGYIPQVPHTTTTFAYLEQTYGAVNEKQVGIGESTCSGVFGAIPLGAPNGTALFSVDELTQLAMERASTAQQAVELMGSLAEQYGFYGAGEFEGTAESLAVSDPDEAWIFHILPDPTGTSAIWAAQRVPDDGFAVLANMFVIRQVDPNDKENFRMSASVHSVALEYKWWSPNDDVLLDFTKVYSDGEYAHKYYSGRRMWGGYRLASPSQDFPDDYQDLQSDPVYPVFTTPDYLLSEQDLFRFHRSTYQGTKYDLGAAENLAGGPFGTPDRWKAGPGETQVPGNWERAIGLYRTSDTYVVQSRSEATTGAVLWFGPASALGTVFTPFLVGLSDVPASFRSGHHAEFSRESAFWAACYAHNIANLKWSYAIKDVEERQRTLETASVALVREMEDHYRVHHNFTAVEEAYLENVATIVSSLWSLSDELMFKYASGFVNEVPDDMSQMVGYPAWWLKAVGYSDGPPPPPTQPKCCHPPLQHLDGATTAESAMEPNVLTGKAAMKQYLRVQEK
jgi:dipeptidase